MNFEVICSENIKDIISGILKKRKLTSCSESNYAIVESGFNLPSDKVSIVFNKKDLDGLIELLDLLFIKADNKEVILSGKREEIIEVVDLDKVLYFEFSSQNVYAVMAKYKLKMKEKLYELEENLPKRSFIRISKGYIVNVLKISEIVPWFGSRFILRFKDIENEIEVTRNYLKDFKKLLGM
jgi:two-component system LytT family response regulator